MDSLNIGFVGLGKLGLPIAEAMATRHKVCGFDIAPRTSQLVDVKADVASTVKNADIVFVAVQTPHHKDYDGSCPSSQLEPRNFDYTQVKEVLIALNPHLKNNQTVVLISTVLPGTTRTQLAGLIPGKNFIYNPYLIAMGTEQKDFLNPEMVIIGSQIGGGDPAIESLKNFYSSLMPADTRYCTGTWEEAESIKIFYNTFISAKLSLVNMIQDVAVKLGHMNVDIVTEALADSDYRIMSKAYMKAGLGDGGPCHPRDNIALRWLSKELDLGYDLFGSIMYSREVQAKNMAQALVEKANNVAILGKAFKPNVPYDDGSYSKLVAHYAQEMGANVWFYDPKIPVDELPSRGVLEELAKAKDLVFLVSYWEDYVHDFKFPEGAIVLDPWRENYSTKGVDFVRYGSHSELTMI